MFTFHWSQFPHRPSHHYSDMSACKLSQIQPCSIKGCSHLSHYWLTHPLHRPSTNQICSSLTDHSFRIDPAIITQTCLRVSYRRSSLAASRSVHVEVIMDPAIHYTVITLNWSQKLHRPSHPPPRHACIYVITDSVSQHQGMFKIKS